MQKQPNLAHISLSKTIESVLNHAIRLDEMSGEAFKPLEDNVIAMTLTPIEQPLYFLFTHAMVSVQTTLQGETDAFIQTTLLDFASLPMQRQLPHAKLSGNTNLAQTFINALCTLEIDWEEQLSHYTGDLIAFKIGHGIRSLLNTQQSVKENVAQTVKEYLQFEIEAVPTQNQINHFCKEVTSINNDLSVLENQINRLLTKNAL